MEVFSKRWLFGWSLVVGATLGLLAAALLLLGPLLGFDNWRFAGPGARSDGSLVLPGAPAQDASAGGRAAAAGSLRRQGAAVLGPGTSNVAQRRSSAPRPTGGAQGPSRAPGGGSSPGTLVVVPTVAGPAPGPVAVASPAPAPTPAAPTTSAPVPVTSTPAAGGRPPGTTSATSPVAPAESAKEVKAAAKMDKAAAKEVKAAAKESEKTAKAETEAAATQVRDDARVDARSEKEAERAARDQEKAVEKARDEAAKAEEGHRD